MKKGDFYSKGYYAGFVNEPRFRKVLDVASKMQGDNFLDIGCGDGSFTVLLREVVKARDTSGIEISPETTEILKEKGINSCQLDIDEETFPFPDNSFDVIYCGEIIEHLFNPDNMLREAYRILKPGGNCIVTTPNLAGWANRLSLLFGYQPFATSVSPENEGIGKLLFKGDEGQWGHIRVFTARALKEILKLHGFKVKKIIGCPVSINTASAKILTTCIKGVDYAMSVFPSLATRVIAIVEK